MLSKTVAMASLSFLLFGYSSVGLSYEIVRVEQEGTITGRIVFTGIPPPPLVFDVKKSPDVCGQERLLHKVEAHRGLLKGAVIVLEGVKKGKPFST